MKRLFALCLAGFLPVVFAAGYVMAADPLADIPVAERGLQQLKPHGIQIGKFLILPSLDSEVHYTDNVLQTNSNTQSDKILLLAPSVSASADFGRHEVLFNARAKRHIYEQFDSQNRTDYRADIGTNFELSNAAHFNVKLLSTQDHNRRLEETGDASEPVQYNRTGFLTELILKPSALEWRIGASVNDMRYKNTRRLSDNSLLVQNDRDRMAYGASVDVTYDVGMGFKPAFGVNYTTFDFDRLDYVDGVGYAGANQDRQRFAALAGIEMVPTGKWRGAAKIGVGYEVADDSNLDNQTTNLVDIDLSYLYTPLTNFNVEFDRFFADDTNATQGIIETRLAASVIHELTRQWILKAGLAYQWRDFQSDGDDETIRSFVDATYRLNDTMTLGGSVEYIDRESNRVNGDFDETKMMIRLKTAY